MKATTELQGHGKYWGRPLSIRAGRYSRIAGFVFLLRAFAAVRYDWLL